MKDNSSFLKFTILKIHILQLWTVFVERMKINGLEETIILFMTLWSLETISLLLLLNIISIIPDTW